MSSLTELHGFDQLKQHYEKNKTKPWKEWLKVKSVFPRPGKQGLVGIMTDKDDEKKSYVFKVSQYINYLTEHELTVMNALNSLANFCPHFCKAFGSILCDVDATQRKEGNPFEGDPKRPVEKEVLLMEYLKNTHKFYNYIRSNKVSEKILYSTVKQVLLAVSLAQKKTGFCHYDLHSNNIMMRKCDKNLVFLYVMDDENQFCIPTHGAYPVVIDFGFSFVGNMDGGPLWPTLGHTEVGFMSDRCDPLADSKLFLVTVSGEIHERKRSKYSRKLRNITKNIFQKLKIDWNSGWDTEVKKSATDYVLDIFQKHSHASPLFSDYDHYCIDILQTLIILPLEKQPVKNFELSFMAFLSEFCKIEKEIGTSFYSLYMLKGIVDAVREVRVDYMNKQSRTHAVEYVQRAVHERLDSILKYCRPKGVHFEKLVCSLLCLARGMEGVLYEVMQAQMSKKDKQYTKVPLKTPEEMCAVIDLNIPDKYVFNNESIIMVIDGVKEQCEMLETTEEQRNALNEVASISWGPELHKIYTEKKK